MYAACSATASVGAERPHGEVGEVVDVARAPASTSLRCSTWTYSTIGFRVELDRHRPGRQRQQVGDQRQQLVGAAGQRHADDAGADARRAATAPPGSARRWSARRRRACSRRGGRWRAGAARTGAARGGGAGRARPARARRRQQAADSDVGRRRRAPQQHPDRGQARRRTRPTLTAPSPEHRVDGSAVGSTRSAGGPRSLQPVQRSGGEADRQRQRRRARPSARPSAQGRPAGAGADGGGRAVRRRRLAAAAPRTRRSRS